MIIFILQSRTMQITWEGSAMRKGTNRIHTTTASSLLDLKTESHSSHLWIFTGITLKTTMSPLDFLSISALLFWLTNGTRTKPTKSANKSWSNASPSSMWEPANQSTECSSPLWGKKEQWCMPLKKSSPNGTSNNSKIEKTKNFGNDLILHLIIYQFIFSLFYFIYPPV